MAEKKKRRGERKDGLIQVALDVGYHPDGRRKRKFFYGRSRAEAERKKEAYKVRLLQGSKFAPDITVSDWISVVKQTYRPRVNAAYLSVNDVPYNRLDKAIGQMRVADVQEADLQRALNEVSGMSFSTVDKYRQAMKKVFERARKNKIIRDNPAEDLQLPSSTKGTHRALEVWEVQLVLAHWNEQGVRAGLWVMLMLLCGLRRGEMIALRWDNIDLERRTVTIAEVAVIQSNKTIIEQRAKTDAGKRILPICNTLFDALSSIPREERTGYVCKSARGKVLTESSVRQGIKTFCLAMERILNGEPAVASGKRTDLMPDDPNRKKFGFRTHDLRHTYATMLYDAGVPVKAAQYFLGHADIRITLDLYTHLSKERETASRNQMVRYLDSWLDDRVVKAWNYEADNLQSFEYALPVGSEMVVKGLESGLK